VEVKVGIVGCGVVGTGTVALLLENAKVIEEKTGIKLSISKVADKDWGRPREYEVPSTLRTY
jgi:homoserine dehydrogenase